MLQEFFKAPAGKLHKRLERVLAVTPLLVSGCCSGDCDGALFWSKLELRLESYVCLCLHGAMLSVASHVDCSLIRTPGSYS